MIPARSARPSDSARFAAILWLAIGPSGASLAQEPAPAADPGTASTPAKTQKVADLTNRYRFAERYTSDDEHPGPGLVGSYRVALLETVKDSVESAQAAPRRSESSRQVIFTERPGEMTPLGTVASATRVYEGYRARPEDPARAMAARPVEGLALLVRPKTGDLPLVLSQVADRTLTEYEYEVVSRQPFVPQLPGLLPTQAPKVGDSWRIPKKAVQALLGDPYIQADNVVGKLAEVRKEVDGPRMVAALAITGKVSGPAGESTVNAEALFTFRPESSLKSFSTKPTFPPRPTEDIVEARGAITELRMVRAISGPLPGPGRLRYQSNRELILHRQLGLGAGAVAPPLVEKTPELTEANSWLTHLSADGRYSYRHPQDLLSPDRSQPAPEANTNLLIRTRREGRDMIQLEFSGKALTPEDLKKEMAEKYATLRMEVTKGSEEWLPEGDWNNMRVHRIEAVVKVADPKAVAVAGSPRIHFDGYLILFGQSASVLVVATTSRDSVTPFRDEVEKVIQSLRLDPGKPAIQ